MAATEPLVCLDDFEKYAMKHMNPTYLDFFQGGANAEETLRENRQAFSKFILRPRVLRDVSRRDLSTTLLGDRISFPVGIAPSSMQQLAHPDGEAATARAAASAGTIMILSTYSNVSIEDVTKVATGGLRWLQLYIQDRRTTENLVQRAERCGFKALVLTVDLPVMGLRLHDIRNKFKSPPYLRLANFDISDERSRGFKDSTEGSALELFTQRYNASLSWKDIAWLRSITNLPIVVKGILTPEDAELAVQHGVSGIIVSNHGGRQLDCVPPTIEALPAIVKTVNGRCEVYIDGGVKTGTDVLKVLALGARAAFIGRPAWWGLCHSGEEGVNKVLDILYQELDVAMALSGCVSVDEIEEDLVMKRAVISQL